MRVKATRTRRDPAASSKFELPIGRPNPRSLGEIAESAPGAILVQPTHVIVVTGDNEQRAFAVVRNLMDGELEAFASLLDGELLDLETIASPLTGAQVDAKTTTEPGFSHAVRWRLSLMAMRQPHESVELDVAVDCTAEFLNEVGRQAADAGIEDLQFRTAYGDPSSPSDLVVTGFVADIDSVVDDPAMEPFHQHAPIPVAAFSTESWGARFVFAFAQPIHAGDSEMRERRSAFIDEVALSFLGFDHASEDERQRQYVPTIIRTTNGSRRRVDRNAVQIATHAIDLTRFIPRLPRRILGLLGVDDPEITQVERDEVLSFLASIGTPAVGVSTLYSRCPLKVHSGRKTYVNTGRDGHIRVCCLSGHGGEGQKQWSERDLLAIARQVAL